MDRDERDGALEQFVLDGFLLSVGLAFFALLLRPVLLSVPTDREGYAVSGAVREYLAVRLVIVNALLLRVFGEVGRAAGEDQSLRQVVNQPLIEGQLWPKLESEEADLLALPQGAWSSEQTGMGAQWVEQLRLLRWVLGIDEDAVGMDDPPQLHWLVLPVGRPPMVRRPPWEIRLYRDGAQFYLVRALRPGSYWMARRCRRVFSSYARVWRRWGWRGVTMRVT